MLRQCIKAGQPVFFGCDVGKSSDSGLMDTGLYDYEVSILFFCSCLMHTMCLCLSRMHSTSR